MDEQDFPFKDKWNAAPFFQWSGGQLTELRKGYAKGVLEVQPHHRGGGGTHAINGGIMAYLFDGLVSAAARTTAREGYKAMSTLSLNIQYLQLLEAEKEVWGEAEVIKSGKSTAFVEARLFNDAGEPCSTCSGIVRLFYQR